jgi:hypothetical protein
MNHHPFSLKNHIDLEQMLGDKRHHMSKIDTLDQGGKNGPWILGS